MKLDPFILAHFDHADLKARVRNAVRCTGFNWWAFCAKHGLPPMGAKEAIDGCGSELDRHVDMIERIAAALGRDLQWVLIGVSSDDGFTIGLKEHSHQLVDQFIERYDIPEEDHSRLHRYIDSMIDSLQARTPQAAFRRGVPQTWRDVAWIYEDLIQLEG
jgi:hypothetical protein